MNTQRFEGIWWKPDDDSNQVAGILTTAGEQMRLELIGSFTDLEGHMEDEPYPILFGLAKGSKLLTLVDCKQTRMNLGIPGFVSKDFVPRAVLVGGHLNKEDLTFPKASFQYSFLPDWVGASGFRRDFDAEDGQLKGIKVTYEFPEDVRVAVPGGELTISFGFRSGGDLLNDSHVRQDVFVRVELEEAVDIDGWFARYIGPLQNLLTLATDKPNAITTVSFYSPRLMVSTSTGEQMSPLELLFTPVFKGEREAKRLFPDNMLFTLNDIRERKEDVINRWLRVAEELDSVCKLFFSVKYRESTYIETRFLSMIGAVESYHRRRIRNRVLSRDKHRQRITTLVNSVPKAHQAWLREHLQFSNEPTLTERLQELLANAEDVADRLIDNAEDFALIVKNTRNYMIHYDEKRKAKAATGVDLARLTEKLSVLIEFNLLLELGWTPAECAERCARSQRFSFAAQRLQS